MNHRPSTLLSGLLTTLGIVLALATSASAQDNSSWFRHAAISPDGSSIAFSHQGDVYVVESDGGLARALTANDAWDGYPVWSRDGKQLAFASDRHGNLDVFLMPAEGGKAKRLTHYSSNDVPADFSVDGDAVLFSSARNDTAQASIFPTGRMEELYEISTEGGTPRMVSTTPASQARYSEDGKDIFYRDEKAYEIEFRKHDVSAFARDIWKLNVESGSHTQLTDFKGGDHDPFVSGDKVYYLSEDKANNFNVWSMDADGDNKKQVSSFETHPVRNLSVSDDGLLCYTQHGLLFTQKEGDDPTQVEVSFQSDAQANDYETKTLKNVAEFAVSPNGKEIAIVSRGEVFVVSRDFGTTVRITDTPQQERSVSFHKDGRTLLYAGERDGKWKLYEASLTDKREKYFFTGTKIEEKEIYSAETESFQPLYSPDGKKIAFLSARDEIQVLDRETGDTNVALGKEHNYSYTDGDITFAWSADSKWLVSDYAPRGRLFIPNIGVFPADGSRQPVDISHSGYQDGAPAWNKSGGNFDKEAIVVDTRWNGGGWLHNDLAKLLSGEEYVTMHVRGREYRGDSLDQWNKPSILVMGEGNYSDAHAFPFTYDVLEIGEMVGMPVPGTMTAVWWETSLSGDMRVGVPQVGMKNKKGEYLENNQTEPDYLVKNDPESTAKGQDKQIEKAVEVMLKQLGEKKE